MASSPMYDPQTSQARSSWIVGLTEICNKLSNVLNMSTSTVEDLVLPELYISENDRFRIYQAPLGNKVWMQSPTPIFKKNGAVITPNNNGFEVDYLGGSIIFNEEVAKTNVASDVFTVSTTYIGDSSGTISSILTQLNALVKKTGNYKGSFDSLTSLNSAFPSGVAGDYAIIQNENTIYVWNENNSAWEDIYKVTDLSEYFTKTEIQALLGTKENNIPAKGTTVNDDLFYFGGRKTWISLIDKVLGATLAGLVTSNPTTIQATDTLLVAFGKLQAQINTFIHPLSGANDPTTATVGKIGQDYINTSNGKKYHLVAIENASTTPSYTWKEYSDVDSMKAYVDTSIQTAIINSWSASY